MSGSRLLRLGGLALIAALLATGLVAAPAAAAVPGLEYVSADSAPTSPPWAFRLRSVRVDCPAGKRVVGAAASVIDPVTAGHTALTSVYPLGDLRAVYAVATSVNPYTPARWRLRVHAICADPLPGLQLVTARSQTNYQPVKVVNAICPAGKRAIGSGASASFRAGPSHNNGRVVLEHVAPIGDLSGVRALSAQATPGINSPWNVEAFAICANPLPGLQLVFQHGPQAAAAVRSANVSCPPGKSLLSPGAQVNGGVYGRDVLWSIIIAPRTGSRGSPPYGAVSVVGAHVPATSPGPWSVTGYAICANT